MTDKLKIGILGTASIAEAIVDAARISDKVEIKAIASRTEEKAEKWAKQHGIEYSFGEYEDLLKFKGIDAVYIPLPNSMHFEWIMKSLEAGLPVLCEKPLCVNSYEVEQVLEASKKYKKPVMEGFMYFHNPMYRKIEQIISDGQIGEVSTINSCFSWYCDDPDSIPARKELSGGALFDVGCYCVHLSRKLAKCEPNQVIAFENRKNVDETMMGIMEFPSGVLAQFETSIANFERHGAEIVGTKGKIVIDWPWVPSETSCEFKLFVEGKDVDIISSEPCNTYALELDRFADIVKDNEGSENLLLDSLSNIKTIEALFESALKGRAVEL